MNFFSEWSKNNTRPSQLSRYAVDHNKWDKKDYEHLLKEIKELRISQKRLNEKIETGEPLYADTYFSLVKADPDLLDPEKVRPSHLVNRAVMGEAMNIKEYEELRFASTGDEIGAALAAIAMEPEILTLWDKLKTQRDAAKALGEQEQNIEALQQEIDDLVNNEEELQPRNFQENLALLNVQMEELLKILGDDAESLQDDLDANSLMIQQGLRSVLKAGLEEVQDQDSLPSWGLSRGKLVKLDAKRRIELAKTLNTPKMRQLADMIGQMKRLAFAEKMNDTNFARNEIYDLTLGNDLAHVIPSEFRHLMDPVRKYDFMRKFVEQELLQYRLRGRERVARGGVYCCLDGSYSMAGARELWAKAVAIVLLHMSRDQNRAFYGIIFGSPGEFATYDFRNPLEIDFEIVIEFASAVFNSGTDFVTPLSECVRLLQEEYDLYGAVQGDIVFITDGECGVPESWKKSYKETREKLGFRTFGVVIGGSVNDEPLNELCDGRVYEIKDLTSGNDLQEVFKLI